jgi:hypothetical protein
MGHDKRDNEEGLMSIEVFWRLPVHGDGRTRYAEQWHRGDYSPHRKSPHPFARTGVQRDGYTYYDHLSQIAEQPIWRVSTACGFRKAQRARSR